MPPTPAAPPTSDELVDAVESELAAVLEAAPAALEAPVPSCPGWVGADVLAHLGRVFTSVERTVAGRAQEVIPREQMPEPPPVPDRLAWVEATGRALVAALRGIDAAEPVWSWSTDRSGRFYHRRMAHEIAVHRVDLDLAAGLDPERHPIAPAVAADGVVEYHTIVLPFSVSRWPRPIPAQPLVLRATDTGQSWTVRRTDPAGPEGVGVELIDGAPASAPVTVRGPAAGLLLRAWARPAPVEIDGDRAIADAWAALAP